MELFIPFFMLAIFAGVFVLVITLSRQQARRTRENLARLAQTLGLPPPAAPATGFFASMAVPPLAGVIRGREVRVFTYTTGSGKNRTTWCAASVAVRNPTRLTLSVSRENVFTKIGRVFGVDDVETGDAAFDAQFYLKSSDPGYIRAALLPEVRTQLGALWSAGARGSFRLEGNEVKYAEPGAFSAEKTCARFPAVVELLHVFGDMVEARA